MNLDQLNLTQHLNQTNIVVPEEIHENDLEFNIELADITTTDVVIATQHDGVDDFIRYFLIHD